MKIPFTASLLLLVSASCASAGIRYPVPDEQAVSRAQLIVIGQLKEDSLQISKTRAVKMSDPSAEAVLIVSEVLKGPFEVAELPIKIAYGLSALVGDANESARPGLQAGQIKIYDTGNSALSFYPITGDLKQNHIWLLRIQHGDSSRKGVTSRTLRIWDPEDIKPTSKKEAIVGLIGEKDSAEVEPKEKPGQRGAGQPATRSGSDSGAGGKPQPETEGRSR